MEAEGGAARLEGFSDAVFGFAVTLLVVSLEVPSTFDELLVVFRALPVFAITFAILLQVWQEHHRFFRKFPASDGVTIWLNGGLLFTVVVYVYPLKFLFGLLTGPRGLWLGTGRQHMIRPDQIVSAMVLYGVGYLAMFALLGGLYLTAWRRCRQAQRRDGQEEALEGVAHCGVYVAVALLSIAVALLGRGHPRAGIVSGLCYVLIAPLHILLRRLVVRRRSRRAARG